MMVKKVFEVLKLGSIYLISLLPLWLLYILSDLMYLLVYYVFRYRRKVVDENLLHAFPEKSGKERQVIRKRYFHYLTDLVVETVKLFTISEQEVKKRVLVSNPEIIKDAFSNGKSVIGVLGHYGNWEIGALRFSQLFSERRVIVYKPLSDNFFNNLMKRMRSRFGATLVSMKNTMRKLVEYRNERTVTVLVGDQTPAKAEIQYFTKFMNQPTAVFLGAERLAKLTNSVVVFCDLRIIKRGYYQCSFITLFKEPKLTNEHEITDTHVNYLEQVIRERPEYWLWSHRRWKFKPEDLQT